MKESPDELRIVRLQVEGFKSLQNSTSIKLQPLTILAGSNSSGKSSAIQPLLLMKQTVESPVDAGPLRLDGDHVYFTSLDQMLSRTAQRASEQFECGLELFGGTKLDSTFARSREHSIELKKQFLGVPHFDREIRPETSHTDLVEAFGRGRLEAYALLMEADPDDLRLQVHRNRCFLEIVAITQGSQPFPIGQSSSTRNVAEALERVLHVPGLRGRPHRVYPLVAVGEHFSGRFEPYTASIIRQWQENRSEQLSDLEQNLRHLELTSTVMATASNDTEVALRVGRTLDPATDTVSLADVGFGISQILPVLVALLTAEPGRLVYLEQPELHLHPRAQYRLADILIAAAKRSVQVVVETHSSLLLTGIQTRVAEGALGPRDVSLNWFTRNPQGITELSVGELDGAGRFGNWPVDFDTVELAAETNYLDAVEQAQ